jgi:PKD repeat protein
VRFGFVVSGSTVFFANFTSGSVDASWDFGDGATSTSWNPQHDYAAPGQYTVTLTAVNGDGVSAHRSHVVTISD